jgi:hypothetical protein
VPALAIAAAPEPGGRYSGKSTPVLGNARHSVVIKVSGDGKRGTFRYCGDRPRRSVRARFRIRKGGRFTATRYERRDGRRTATFKATGRFASRSKVRGRIVVVFRCDFFPGSYTARLTG